MLRRAAVARAINPAITMMATTAGEIMQIQPRAPILFFKK